MAKKVEKKVKKQVEEPIVYKGHFIESIRENGIDHPYYYLVEEYDAEKK